MAPRISLFPKCYFDELVSGTRSFEQWIRDAATLGGEGVEHYDGWFRSFEPRDVDPIVRVMEETGQVTSMLCFSPDFTHPDAGERRRQVERQKAAIDLTVRLGARHCRTLSGQRYQGMTRAEGIARTLEGIRRALEHKAPERGHDSASRMARRNDDTTPGFFWFSNHPVVASSRRTPREAESSSRPAEVGPAD